MRLLFFLIILTFEAYSISDVNDIRNNVGWEEKYGSSIDLKSQIVSVSGEKTNLNNILNKDIPTVFVLAYYSCPKMCSFILDGVKDVVQASNKRPGIDYNLVTLSFNSRDSSESSKVFENKYSSILNADESWNFYTSDNVIIEKITKSVGFKFQPDGDEFAHPAGIILLTNDGIVSRYLSGVIYDPRDFKLAIIEASQGSTGTVSLSDKVLLYCFDFDPVGKKYALRALNVMKLGGAITLFAIIIMMGFLWLRKNKGEQ